MQRNEWLTVCLVRASSYEQVLEEIVADCLHHTSTRPVGTRLTTEKKCFHFRITKQSIQVEPRGGSQAAACNSLIYTVTLTVKTGTYRETRCPYFKIKINESFIKQITGQNSPLVLKLRYIYI